MNPKESHQESLRDSIKQLQLAIKSTATYPGDHPTSYQTTNKSYETLADLLDKKTTLTISVSGSKFLVDNIPIDGKDASLGNFARDLDQRAIESINFYHGLSMKEFMIFLNTMIKSPNTLKQEGGIASILHQHGISTIKLNGIKYGKISDESKQLENTHIINYLSGENDNLGDYGHNLLHILENDPQRVSGLIMQATEAKDITIDPYNQATQAKVAVETMNRIATELLARQGVQWNQFKDDMTSILSTWDEDMLKQMSQNMEIIEGEKGEILDDLVSQVFYNAMADICVDEYRQNSQFDTKFLERLIPSVEERKRLFPYLKRKLNEFETSDEEKIISDLFGEEPEIKEEDTHDHNPDASNDEERKKIKDEVTKLLSEGKSDEVQKIIKELSKKLDDTSRRIRKKVAESFLEITPILDKFDKLQENFRDMSEALLNRLKQENYSDTYLIVSENFYKLCTAQNRISTYFTNETLGRRLFEAKKLSNDQLQNALMARKKNGKSLQYNLGNLNYVDEAVLTYFLSQQYNGCRIAHLSAIHDIPENALKAVPVKFIKSHLILPFRLDSGNLYIAMMNPNDLDVLSDIRFTSGYSVVPHLASEYHLLDAIENFYHIQIVVPESNHAMENIQGQDGLEFCEGKEEEEVPATEEENDSDAPVIRLVNMILKAAITQKASDIHIEPYENELRVRFRIDGTLMTKFTPSIAYANVIASRIKIMSGLDISERRLPQDGRFKARMNGSYVDFRVSTFPGIFGEKVVLRLLDKSNLALDINNLGLNSNDLTTVLTAMHRSKGMILVTGPTGSGKTTTLYSMLHGLNDGSRNISTAEDPIEYNQRGINQFQMKPKIGLDFARALRTFLRQDPDIIMVGEIRDLETAEIAVKAALTGHLVLSTLHTNSALETVTRLLDMGIEPYLITSSLNLLVAQRLMRKICENCKVHDSPSDLQKGLLKDYGFTPSDHQLFRGEGCDECNNTGYKGRIAIYEVMPMWDEIQELILRKGASSQMKQKATELGFVTLQEQGLKKVTEGITDLNEWMRVVA